MIVVCLGGGASVTGADLERVGKARLDGRCGVIAINSAIYGAWWADAHYAADLKWWLANVQQMSRYTGCAFTSDTSIPARWPVTKLLVTGERGFDPTPGAVRTGRGSGYQALHLAMQRSKRIVLLGYDMHGGHWHGGYDHEPACDYGAVMVPPFESLCQPAAARGIEIINASENSALRCFPKAPLHALL